MTGCNNQQSKPTRSPTQFELRPQTHKPYLIYKGVALHFPSTIEGWHRELLIEAAQTHIDTFCMYWGLTSVKAVDVYCFPLVYIPCGTLSGSFTGCHYGTSNRSGIIHVAYGRENTLPALFHELTHDILKNHDPNHTDSRWREWDAKCGKIHEQILIDRLK